MLKIFRRLASPEPGDLGRPAVKMMRKAKETGYEILCAYKYSRFSQKKRNGELPVAVHDANTCVVTVGIAHAVPSQGG